MTYDQIEKVNTEIKTVIKDRVQILKEIKLGEELAVICEKNLISTFQPLEPPSENVLFKTKKEYIESFTGLFSTKTLTRIENSIDSGLDIIMSRLKKQ